MIPIMTSRDRKSATEAGEGTVRARAGRASVAFGDPDEGLMLRDEFAEELRRSLAEVDAGGRTSSLSEVSDRLHSPE